MKIIAQNNKQQMSSNSEMVITLLPKMAIIIVYFLYKAKKNLSASLGSDVSATCHKDVQCFTFDLLEEPVPNRA